MNTLTDPMVSHLLPPCAYPPSHFLFTSCYYFIFRRTISFVTPFVLVIWSHSSSHTIWFLDGLSPCPSPSPLGHSPPHYITRTRIHFTPTGLLGHIIMNMIYHPNAYLISHTLPPRSHTLFAFHQFIASSIQISHASIPLP